MSDLTSNEQLLTAYFDGELTGEDRARVEKLLMDSPQYRQMVEQWRSQSLALREFPRYELREDFATDVLRTIEQQSTERSPRSIDPMSHWRVGVAAIATLAALLLLTVFVFPRVGNDPLTASKLGLKSVENVVNEPVLAKDLELDSKADSWNESAKLETADHDDALQIGSKKQIDAPAPIRLEPTTIQAAEPNLDYSNQNGRNFKSAPSQIVGEYDKSRFSNFESQNKSREIVPQQLTAPQENRARLVRPEEGLSEQERSEQERSEQPALQKQQLVSQVLVIEFTSGDQPLAALERVFGNNQIQIRGKEHPLGQTAAPGGDRETDGFDRNDGALNERRKLNQSAQYGALIPQPATDMEALFVVSTEAQMQHAIEELSEQAKISGLEIAPEELFFFQQSFEQSDARSSRTQTELSSTDTRGRDPTERQSAAQQLRFNELNKQMLPARRAGNGAVNGIADQAELGETQANNDVITLADDAVEEESVEIDIDANNRVQYLLFVRTQPAPLAAAKVDAPLTEVKPLEAQRSDAAPEPSDN